MKDEQITELLLQALETELGGVEVYRTALKCVVNADLQEELTSTSPRRPITSRWSGASSRISALTRTPVPRP